MSINGSIPVRVFLFAIVAAAASLAAVVYVPPLLRPGVPVYLFRQMPDPVAGDLNRRSCNIVRGNNVLSEDFAGTGQRDWAILCQQGGQASLLLYLAGKSQPAVFNTHGAGLVEDPESQRRKRIVRWDYVARHNPGIRTAAIPKACVEDGVGMGSILYCYLDGDWSALTGAD